MKVIKNCLYLLICLISLVPAVQWAQAQGTQESLPAFPGAEGFGATAIGGRGGRVIKVTNLNTSGPGSLQEACSAEGPRIVVFDTSGVINGDVVIDQSNITIAGQTAPGAGITINGRLMTRYNNNRYNEVVVRFLRVRPNFVTGSGGDGIQFGKVSNCMIDHISCAWGNDEVIDVYNANNLTVQWCTIEESDTEGHDKGIHNFGMINGPDGGKFSLHHCLFAHNRRRNPAIAHGPSDIRNIVVYDFRDGLSHEGHPPNNLGFNLIGNYYKPGPSSSSIFPFCFVDTISYYLRDNYIEGVGLIQDPWAEADKLYGLRYYQEKGRKAVSEYAVPPVTTHSPEQAYTMVLESAGCFPQDTVTRRTIAEVKSVTGSFGRHQPQDLMAGLTVQAPPRDSDNDGMPDAWERANGLNPADSTDHGKTMPSGYTAIEDYCNMMAAELIRQRTGLPRKGDLDRDGSIGIFDLLGMLKALSDTDNWAADLNYDQRINIFDLLEMLKTLTHLA